MKVSLQWCHNECNGVSNHRCLVCLLKSLFRNRSKKISKLSVTGLCEGNSLMISEFRTRRASNAENVSIWWCHHDSKNALVCAKWQWNARDCVTWLHIQRSRECNPLTTAYCVWLSFRHYTDITMGAIASQITSLTIVYSIVYSDTDQRKHQSSASLAFVRGIHRGPVNSPHKWPVTWKIFPFDDIIMAHTQVFLLLSHTYCV